MNYFTEIEFPYKSIYGFLKNSKEFINVLEGWLKHYSFHKEFCIDVANIIYIAELLEVNSENPKESEQSFYSFYFQLVQFCNKYGIKIVKVQI